jgi:uncharacterized protein (DUF488 family)
MTVFTIGHSTRSIEDFIAALKAAGVGMLADIRRFPTSRRFPHFNGENLAPALAAVGIGYRHFPELGGRRGKRADGEVSPNTLWRQEPFRNYADYAETGEFRAAFDKLAALARESTVAIMCAEAVWWQCHRRIVTDYLLSTGCTVRHIMGPGKIDAAKLTPGAVVEAPARLLYPPEQGSLL